LSATEDLEVDGFSSASISLLRVLVRNYPDLNFPTVFNGRYLVAFADLLRGCEKQDFNSESLYVFVSLLIFELGDEVSAIEKNINEFLNVRERLSGASAYNLFRYEISVAEQVMNNAKSRSDYSRINKYLGEVEKYSNREKDLKGLVERSDQLKAALEQHKNAFNFVFLTQGFSSLRSAKSFDKNLRVFFLFFIGMLALAPLVLKLVLIIMPGNIPLASAAAPVLENASLVLLGHDVSSMIALVGIEVLLLYFFRITLHSLKSIRAQLLQLDLRMALCQFIQDYAKYALETKGQGVSLDRFENIIFSGIVTSEENMPSTFDGIDVVRGLIKELK
jgi:hypothetical protein